ncbi:UNVERIFIED_CONTAM: hypothetical protein PYX00_009729 [Menopon gallinae]|uniref:Cytochrome P450 n=1 Tax=Menopon gallinae TaxID=328185 RepID=A0AAW2HCF9_9NEOP
MAFVTIFLILVIVLITVISVFIFVTGKPSKNFPPGPVRLPIWGSYLHVLWEDFAYPFKAFENLKYKYNAPIIGCYLGSSPTIVANDYATCKAILSKPEFQGRPEAFPVQFRMFGKQLGLFAGEGESWLRMKRFSLRNLRDIGFGRRSDTYEAVLGEETRDFIAAIQNECLNGRSVLIPEIFYPPLFNCIFYLMIGHRYPVSEHEKLRRIGRAGLKFITSNNVTGNAVGIIPWIRHILPDYSGFRDLSESSMVFEKFMREQFKEHKQTFDESSLRDMVDNYIKAQDEYKDFTDEQTLITSIDFLFPNTAIAVVLSFAMIYLIKNPKVREKCQEQIDAVVGTGRLPHWTTDRRCRTWKRLSEK